jgi:hypothetical protein
MHFFRQKASIGLMERHPLYLPPRKMLEYPFPCFRYTDHKKLVNPNTKLNILNRLAPIAVPFTGFLQKALLFPDSFHGMIIVKVYVDACHSIKRSIEQTLHTIKHSIEPAMKKKIHCGSLVIGLVILFSGCEPGAYTSLSTVTPTVSFQTFYDDLSPYGTWMDYPGYGQVWHPRLDEDFRPYATNGYWVYSNEGWAWESGYNWGWAPFHYGQWTYDDLYGWLWIPGYEWSPAWVTWGMVDDYYAWAPLMPGVNLSVQFGAWRPNNFYWNLCQRNHIHDRDLKNRITRPDGIRDFDHKVSIINNFNTTRTHKQFYSRGPAVNEVEKYSNQRIDRSKLTTVRKVDPEPQNGNKIRVFRPNPVQPAPQHPVQPREYRKVESNQINPIRTPEQRPTRQREEQNQNINRLPVFKGTETPKIPNRENRPQKGRSKNLEF